MTDPLKIGVVGYSATQFDSRRAQTHLANAFTLLDETYPNRAKIVVSGLTDLGIPALAYREAVRRGYLTAAPAGLSDCEEGRGTRSPCSLCIRLNFASPMPQPVIAGRQRICCWPRGLLGSCALAIIRSRPL